MSLEITDECSGFLYTNVGGTEVRTPISRDVFLIEKEIDSTGYYRYLKACRDGRWYFLKCLRAPFNEQEFFCNMLLKEYTIMSSLSHPGVVHCYGMEDVPDYGNCIIMEYIEGVTLEEFIIQQNGNSKSVQKRLLSRIAIEMAQAIAYIHSYQIVHRDLKPSNIMVTKNGQNVKIIDFGLSDSDDYMILKQPAGTMKYMAPEQLDNFGTDVRADIYSFGVILRSLFANSGKFTGKKQFIEVSRKCVAPIKSRYQNMSEVVSDLKIISELKPFYARPSFIASVVSSIVLLACFSFYLFNSQKEIYITGTNVLSTYLDDITANYGATRRNALEKAVADFEKDRPNLAERIQNEQLEREAFLMAFTPDSIRHMKFEDFNIDNTDGFCFKLRNRMKLFGDLTPYPLFSFYSSFDEEQSFLELRNMIIDLLQAGEKNKQEDLFKAMPRTPLRFRILSLYYPDFYLPIMSDNQAQQISDNMFPERELPLQYSAYSNIDAYNLLQLIHDENKYFSNMSLVEYSIFLLNYFPGVPYEYK